MPYTCFVLKTVAETDVFQRYAAQIWSNSELARFIDWIAANPLSGDVIPGAGGCRKVRWSRSGMGKRGGVRVIYFNSADGRIWLLIVYTKAKFDTLSADFLARLKAEVMNHG
ncbi:MAG: transcriptional regulator [Pseudomonadota bacterium]|nr:transcriptional regulator [Pseudomonadota bacterium]